MAHFILKEQTEKVMRLWLYDDRNIDTVKPSLQLLFGGYVASGEMGLQEPGYKTHNRDLIKLTLSVSVALAVEQITFQRPVEKPKTRKRVPFEERFIVCSTFDNSNTVPFLLYVKHIMYVKRAEGQLLKSKIAFGANEVVLVAESTDDIRIKIEASEYQER